MKINVSKEAKEMKKNARKIGDKTGIGFSASGEDGKEEKKSRKA